MKSEEKCIDCGDSTGRAGQSDDSMYCPCGDGPFCEDCWTSHLADCLVAQMEDAE